MYGFGYRRDKPHKRAFAKPIGHLLAGLKAQTLPSLFSMRSRECPTLHQGQTGSCTAGGTAHQLWLAGLGFILSPKDLYAATRGIERALATPVGQTMAALNDVGAEPADVVNVLARYGVTTMVGPTPDGRNYDLWSSQDTGSYTDQNVNDEPDLLELEKSGTRLVAGTHRILETSSNIEQEIMVTLAGAGCSVGIGTFVDSQVLDFTASSAPVDVPNTNDPRGGGHWITIMGWRPSVVAPGEVDWEVWNTWGSAYGDAGHFWARERWVQSAMDLYAMTGRTL